MKKKIFLFIALFVFIAVYFIYCRPINKKDCVGFWGSVNGNLTFTKNGEVTYEGGWHCASELEIPFNGTSEEPDKRKFFAKGYFEIDKFSSYKVILYWEYLSIDSSELSPIPKEAGSELQPWVCLMLFRSISQNYLFTPVSDRCYYKEKSQTP